MKDMQSIKRIRWENIAGGRWYGVSYAIRHDEKDTCWEVIRRPVQKEDDRGLTANGLKIVNRLIAIKGITQIELNSFGLIVKINPVFFFEDYHDDIIDLLNKTLFNGRADIGECGVRKEGEGLIRWASTRSKSVRWYGVSTALTYDTKNSGAFTINSPVDQKRNWCGLTDEALELVNKIYAMKGVCTLWVSAFNMSIEIAPVFSWSDYHTEVVKLITDLIFDGKAFVEEKKDA